MTEDYEYKKFRENIRIIVEEEVMQILQHKNLYETHSGTITDIIIKQMMVRLS